MRIKNSKIPSYNFLYYKLYGNLFPLSTVVTAANSLGSEAAQNDDRIPMAFRPNTVSPRRSKGARDREKKERAPLALRPEFSLSHN